MIKKTYENINSFFKEVSAEFKKVAFPTRNETMISTTVVIVFVIIVSIILAVIDTVLIRFIKFII